MMSPSESEDDAKKAGVRPEPLCLFCFPDESPLPGGKTYVGVLREERIRRGTGTEEGFRRLPQDARQREREEFWLRKRTEARIRRRRTKEPIRNLKSYLFTSVKNEKPGERGGHLPSLFEVLETVKDAWPSPSNRSGRTFLRHEGQSPGKSDSRDRSKMKNEQIKVEFPCLLLNRRLSMPEELMRKYSVSKEKTSEESETTKTAVEISPSSSSTLETARRRETEEPKAKGERPKAAGKTGAATANASQQTSDPEEVQVPSGGTDFPQRVTQSDYYKQGKRIIKVRAAEGCTCEREVRSSTTASAKDETDDSGTTESVASSSPTQLPKRESSSGNLSSESDNIRCTCAELSSVETSTDLYLSGKSTLSQTVSDKSVSTQDSTVSVNSVSSRGSTVSDESNSTTPEVERTSAKETTTSPDYSPRTPRNRKNRKRDKHGWGHGHHVTCPRHGDGKQARNGLPAGTRQCPVHSPTGESRHTANAATNTDRQEEPTFGTETTEEAAEKSRKPEAEDGRAEGDTVGTEERYKWAKLSQEELYMMQQLRHRRFVESQRKVSGSLPAASPGGDSITACGTGSAYMETEPVDRAIMIPRYSALPRSLSMLVNTSSADVSHDSDSDNQSLADSLEDQPVAATHVHKLYFDTKKESKPVRGDASVLQENRLKHRQPRGRAFFVSIKDPYGEDEMLENIERIPQPPEKIKNQISKRHLSLCAKHKHLHHPEDQKEKKSTSQKSRRIRSKNEDGERTAKGRRTGQEESRKVERKSLSERGKRKESEEVKTDPPETGSRRKEGKGCPGSKIPVPVGSRSTSSSPERDSEKKEKSARPKARLRREREGEGVANPQTEVETTQILEITHTGTELSLQKPQAVIHPSQAPTEPRPGPPLVIPPLVSTLKMPPFRQTWNKPILAPVRRSPIAKFRQRFEVIPEEKSSSLSSAEEKNGRETLPRFADASTSPVPSDRVQFQSYNVNEVPNLIVAKITNKHLETVPYVNAGESQKIILFSSRPQNSNSSKGRDALIAMNREDFSRLAKGWMNFYKLNENMENSETEGRCRERDGEGEETKRRSKPKPSVEEPGGESRETETGRERRTSVKEAGTEGKSDKMAELGENVRFDCSNTILRTGKGGGGESGRSVKRESRTGEEREVEKEGGRSGWREGRKGDEVDEEDETDSDSTDYMEPPSPRVPPLPIDDIPSDATLSSSDSELEAPKPQITTQALRYLPPKKRSTTTRARPKKENPLDTSRGGKKKNSGWSVTVAGTVELSRSAPDLEMRLSFPASGGPPVVSQSDSGFAEESNCSKRSESVQEVETYTSRRELPFGEGNTKRKWLVTVKNPKSGDGEGPRKSSHHLPHLEPTPTRNPKNVLKKDAQLEDKVRRLVERKMRAIWPKVQKVIRKEFLTDSGRLITELEDGVEEGSCLSVRGSAVSLERKQRAPTMTERDVTRRYTSRGEQSLRDGPLEGEKPEGWKEPPSGREVPPN